MQVLDWTYGERGRGISNEDAVPRRTDKIGKNKNEVSRLEGSHYFKIKQTFECTRINIDETQSQTYFKTNQLS